MTLYQTDEGQLITTHSMIKTFRRCPKQADYKYAQRLKPKSISRPLQFGKWMHWLLEAYYKGEDWLAVHEELCHKYSMLFDEEKEQLGNLPVDCLNLMKSYLWHYANENWTVHEVEYTVECEWPDGGLYRGKVDMLVEDQFGLWIVDHKNHKQLPDSQFRLRDAQSALYVWAARKSGIPVSGFIWNYLKTAPPSLPRVVKDGSRFYSKMGDTTYYAYVKEVKRLGLDATFPSVRETVARLKGERYEFGKIQTSAFFQRHVLERDDAMLERMASQAYHTHKRMHKYPFHRPEIVEAVPDRSCKFMCSYTRLCEAELMGGMTQHIRRDYREADPMEYYGDEKNLGE